MNTSLELENKLANILPILSKVYKIRKIGYFGSFRMGDQTESSDVDLLIDFRTTPGWEFFDLIEYLETQLGRKVDIVTSRALKKQLRKRILDQVKYIQ